MDTFATQDSFFGAVQMLGYFCTLLAGLMSYLFMPRG